MRRRIGHHRDALARSPRRLAAALERLRAHAAARIARAALGSSASVARAAALAGRAASAPLLVRAAALALARREGWAAAEPAVRTAFRVGEGSPALARAILAPRESADLTLVGPASRTDAAVAPDPAARVVVYTAVFGDGPAPEPVFGAPEGVRFLCFTDRADAPTGWRRVHAPAGPLATARLKLRPHEALATVAPDAAWSLWLDPDRSIVGNLDTLLGRWLLRRPFVLWRHPVATDWRALAEDRLAAGYGPAAAIAAQAAACEAATPSAAPACYDTGAIWRRHGDPGVIAAMEAWWSAEAAAPGADDLGLWRALAAVPEGAATPEAMPASVGDALDNVFFARVTRGRATTRGGAAGAAPGRASGRRPVTVLYSPLLPHSTTTLLRGKQLSEMVAARHGDALDLVYTCEIDAVRDRVVVVTKEALQHSRPETLATLAARNLALIGAWEDSQVDEDKIGFLDAHMALSIRHMLDLNRLYPTKPAFHVTHHVNTAVRPLSPPQDRLRTAYFGEFGNTVCPGSISAVVDLVGTDTMGVRARVISDDWLVALPRYNCHWIVRRSQAHDGWKPFLKGFVAARCNAPVIVTRDDANASHYLGDDYPFYAASLAPADLETAWIAVRDAFGGPDWRLALGIMRQVAARSGDDQVCLEFRRMIETVLP